MLTPLPPEAWDDDLDEARTTLGTPLNIHRVLANHPALLRAWMPFRQHIVDGNTLSPRHREMVILRTAYHGAVDYEWVHHVARGKVAGLTDEEIDRIRFDGVWPPEEALLIQAVDECYYSQLILPETRDALAAHFTPQQMLDLLMTVGTYITMTLVLETFDVPLEDDSADGG